MRTTIDVPDPLFREIKSIAARKGSTLKEWILRAIRKEMARARGKREKYSAKLPLIKSKRPGTLRTMTNEEIEDLLS